jgi:hypothetical protein
LLSGSRTAILPFSFLVVLSVLAAPPPPSSSLPHAAMPKMSTVAPSAAHSLLLDNMEASP